MKTEIQSAKKSAGLAIAPMNDEALETNRKKRNFKHRQALLDLRVDMRHMPQAVFLSAMLARGNALRLS